MNEQNQEFDPRDLNHDGKVSFDERVKYAADKAGAAIQTATGAVMEGAGKVAGQVKAYADLTPEERKAKNAELKGKAVNAADKAANAAKGVFEEMKEGAEKLFGGKKEA